MRDMVTSWQAGPFSQPMIADWQLHTQAKSASKDGVQRVKDLFRWFQSRTMSDDAQQPSTEPLHRPWRG